MKEFRVQGLSCPNCTQQLEQDIRRLEYGESASLSYNSGKLKMDERVSLEQVGRILKSDGARIVPPEASASDAYTGDSSHHDSHAHDHSASSHAHEHSAHTHDDAAHSHSHNSEGGTRRMIVLLSVSAALYLAAVLLGGLLPAAASAALCAAAALLSGFSTFRRGVMNLTKFRFNIDTLMTIALIGAAAIGDWKEAALVAILFGVNELLEGFGMEKARKSLETLLKAAPKTATKVENGEWKVVPVSNLRTGDVVVVKPGEKIPSDGTVDNGSSSVNEAAITGESLPVDKNAGDVVFGGSVNNDGVLHIRIDKAYEDSSLAKMLHLVEEAQETKTPTELFINRFARYYTPLIILAAVLVIVVPPLLFGGSWHEWLYQGLAVLIVGCPCALILSSPIAIVSGIARNARNGILIKGGVFLEQLGRLDTLAFDKTGTLTEGRPSVERTIVYDEKTFFAVAGAIEKTSLHPLAQAVVREIERIGVDTGEAERIEAIPGQGMRAVYEGRSYWLGNEKSVRHITWTDEWLQDAQALRSEGLALVILADESRILGMFGIADRIRPESKEVISELRRSGIRRTVMLTGDHSQAAEKIARSAGIDDYYAGLLPEDKVASVKDLAIRGTVGMIGDGINDAPALASAQLGIAMGKGTDSAIETADIVLLQDHLGKLPEAIRIARRVNRVVRFNLAVALGLKLIALLLTIPGWLTLWIAILSDMGATVFVTLVSLTILIRKRKPAA